MNIYKIINQTNSLTGFSVGEILYAVAEDITAIADQYPKACKIEVFSEGVQILPTRIDNSESE